MRIPTLLGISLILAWLSPLSTPFSTPFSMPIAHGEDSATPPPLKILLVTGGGFHDYPTQSRILSQGLEERLHAEVTVNLSNEEHHPAYSGERWAEGFDVVIHNTCATGNTDDPEQVKIITDEHARGIPAVMLHCAMHCFRPGGPHEYQKLLGVLSRNHEKHHPVTITKKSDHPIMAGFPEEWTTPKGELYRILNVMPGVTPLAMGVASEEQSHLCYWIHEYGKARVFGTTIGHHNETMQEKVYLDTLARGVLWATGHLNDDGSPAEGYGRNLK